MSESSLKAYKPKPVLSKTFSKLTWIVCYPPIALHSGGKRMRWSYHISETECIGYESKTSEWICCPANSRNNLLEVTLLTQKSNFTVPL